MSNTMRLYRGDTGHFRFTCVDSAGTALDLTIATATFTVKASTSDTEPLIEKTLASGLTVVAPASSGLIDLELLPVDTNVLDPGHYVYDLQLTLGAYVYTVVSGLVELKADVTRTPVARATAAAAATATAYGATVAVA